MDFETANKVCDALSDLKVVKKGASLETWYSDNGMVKLLGHLKNKKSEEAWMIYYRNIISTKISLSKMQGSQTEFFKTKDEAILRIRELLL